jgi:heptosyltransferase-2
MKVMIRVPNWVGDAVMAVPALCHLRRIFDDARITLVARPWVAGLFEGEGLADDMIFIEDARGPVQSLGRAFKDARRLSGERFDYAVLLQNAFSAALVARLARARNITGYATDARRRLLDHVVDFEPDHKKRHQVFYYLNIASQIEKKLTGASRVDMSQAEPRLRVSDERRAEAFEMLERCGLGRRARIVALNPGATNSRAKQWMAERFAAAADRFAEREGFQTIIIGAEGDREVAERVSSAMRTSAAMLAGKTSVAELKSVLSCASLVISNDTGAAHVSAALGVPTLVIFGPTEHFATRPLSNLVAVVRKDVDCSPCMLRDCPIDHRCMAGVEVEEV